MHHRRRALASSWLLLLALGPGPARGAADADGVTEVMVLGTYHFANPGLDAVNATVDDVLTEARQAEIEAVVESLARFAPTKILLEMPASAEASFNARYREFLAGDRDLGRNEHDQLGMRLAAELGHERLFGIDASLGLDLLGALEVAVDSGQDEVANRLDELLREVRDSIAEIHAPGRTTAQMLRSHNQPARALDANLYMVLAEVGTEDDPFGADLVADWHKRNLRIFANLLRQLEEGDERVLVIYGSGHRRLLSEFVRDHPDLQVVDPLEYLPAE